MSRWAPDAALRLERAALELFLEQGYVATTVPQITARAGLTTRTFFRHFPDKREVLFLRERELPTVVRDVLARAPAGLSPHALVVHGFETVVADGFERWRDQVSARRAVVRTEQHLRERELLKQAVLADAVEQALVRAGAGEPDARLLARAGVLAFDLSLDEWLDQDAGRPLLQVLRGTTARMRRLLG